LLHEKYVKQIYGASYTNESDVMQEHVPFTQIFIHAIIAF